MFFVAIIGFIFLFCISVCFRLFVQHPFKTIFYAAKDLYFYFKHLEFNNLDGGKLIAYVANFGKGKTLSIVHYVVALFNRYNNKKVWDRSRGKFVTQKIHIVSNVDLKTVPYEPLVSLSQVVQMGYVNRDIDFRNDTKTVVLVVLDEASVQLNSRSFKDNIDPLFLNTLLTSRHYHISIFYSTQKFNLTDKLLRDVTQHVIKCDKVWRFMVQETFCADDIEYASDPTLVKPLARGGFFVTDADYASYDTLACVDNLKKKVDEKDMLSEQDILAMRGELNPDDDSISRPSRKLLKRRKIG